MTSYLRRLHFIVDRPPSAVGTPTGLLPKRPFDKQRRRNVHASRAVDSSRLSYFKIRLIIDGKFKSKPPRWKIAKCDFSRVATRRRRRRGDIRIRGNEAGNIFLLRDSRLAVSVVESYSRGDSHSNQCCFLFPLRIYYLYEINICCCFFFFILLLFLTCAFVLFIRDAS